MLDRALSFFLLQYKPSPFERHSHHLKIDALLSSNNTVLCFPPAKRERESHCWCTACVCNYTSRKCNISIFSVFFCEFKVRAALAVKSSYKYEALTLRGCQMGMMTKIIMALFLLILRVRDLHKTVASFVLSTINCRFPTLKIQKIWPTDFISYLNVLLITKLTHIFPILCGF